MHGVVRGGVFTCGLIHYGVTCCDALVLYIVC